MKNEYHSFSSREDDNFSTQKMIMLDISNFRVANTDIITVHITLDILSVNYVQRHLDVPGTIKF